VTDALVQAMREAIRAELAVELPRALAPLVEALRASQAPRLVSPAEAAAALGVSIATCRRRIADGTLPSRHLGRRVVCDLSNARPVPAREARGS
jgi:DNA-directed RNA polymerase specialized sigma24 family protein